MRLLIQQYQAFCVRHFFILPEWTNPANFLYYLCLEKQARIIANARILGVFSLTSSFKFTNYVFIYSCIFLHNDLYIYMHMFIYIHTHAYSFPFMMFDLGILNSHVFLFISSKICKKFTWHFYNVQRTEMHRNMPIYFL